MNVPLQTIKYLQRRINRMGCDPELAVDGIDGPQTKSAEWAYLTFREGPPPGLGALADVWPDAIRMQYRVDTSPWNLKGLDGATIYALRHDNEATAFCYVSKCDIDSDGPGGSKAQDHYWQADTSLHWPGGEACNSRTFPGIVLPPCVCEQFDVRMGDVGFCAYNGRLAIAAVYDGGPNNKLGEISVALARELGIPSSPSSGGVPHGLSTLVFPRSGNGRALLPVDMAARAKAALAKVLQKP